MNIRHFSIFSGLLSAVLIAAPLAQADTWVTVNADGSVTYTEARAPVATVQTPGLPPLGSQPLEPHLRPVQSARPVGASSHQRDRNRDRTRDRSRDRHRPGGYPVVPPGTYTTSTWPGAPYSGPLGIPSNGRPPWITSIPMGGGSTSYQSTGVYPGVHPDMYYGARPGYPAGYPVYVPVPVPVYPAPVYGYPGAPYPYGTSTQVIVGNGGWSINVQGR